MEDFQVFCNNLKDFIGDGTKLTINDARSIIKEINDFLYTTHPEIGNTNALGRDWPFFSEFHKFWQEHHKEILDCRINEKQCELVADALHDVYKRTKGGAFENIYDTCGLDHEAVCRVRFLTANQDFRGSLDFSSLAAIYNTDPSIFDEKNIYDKPSDFVESIGLSAKSQTDKRQNYASKIAEFLLQKQCKPIDLIKVYHGDIYKLRTDLINYQGAGYGNKKADMFLRDMVVLNIWSSVSNFDKIDVASDVNTIKVALRTGIISTSIPLVSSFLDIFCHQYSYIDEMNAFAWRQVWEIWNKKYLKECIKSPCLIDYFVYKVVGKQFCKESLYLYQCENEGHQFYWHAKNNHTCQICYRNGTRQIRAIKIRSEMPCSSPNGSIAIRQTPYVKLLPSNQKIDECPFKEICDGHRNLQPPKSISIMGQTGWTTAYTEINNGGGGLMA